MRVRLQLFLIFVGLALAALAALLAGLWLGYHHLAQAGARILTVPSSFARPTGRAHWHVLLRARAVETGCFVMAPAQCGDHEDGRKTFGHSLIVSPWGEVLAEAGEKPGVILADLDLDAVDRARSMVPSLDHDRSYSH